MGATKSKDKFYFSHDSNARRDPKMIALRSKYGYEGYGRFFALVEILREEKDYRIDTTKSYIIHSVSHELNFESKDLCEAFIKDCLNFELLESDGIFVWSNSLNARMEMFEAKRERYRQLAKKRWGNKNKDEINKDEKNIQEKSEGKDKTKRKKKYSSIESLRSDKEFAEIKEEIRKKDEFNCLSDEIIEYQRRSIIDWLVSKDKRYQNYKAFFFNILRKHIRENKLDEKSDPSEKKMVY